MKNLTSGVPLKIILLFALPIIAGNLLQLSHNIIGAYIVGQVLGVTSLAAVGSTTPLFHMLLGFSTHVTNGFSIRTAQYFGSGDMESVRRSFATGIILSIIISLIIMIIFIPSMGLILRLMRTPQEIIAEARAYITVIIGGVLVTMLYNLFAGILRGVGDSKTRYLKPIQNYLKIRNPIQS